MPNEKSSYHSNIRLISSQWVWHIIWYRLHQLMTKKSYRWVLCMPTTICPLVHFALSRRSAHFNKLHPGFILIWKELLMIWNYDLCLFIEDGNLAWNGHYVHRKNCQCRHVVRGHDLNKFTITGNICIFHINNTTSCCCHNTAASPL